MYCAKNFVQLEGYALESLFPLQGVLAGCPFATFLVQVNSHGPASRFQQDPGGTDLFLSIDEWAFLNQDSHPKNLVTRTVESPAQATQLTREDLQCDVAHDKSGVVASSGNIRHDLARSMGKHMGSTEVSAANLGVDTAGG
eukprot:2539137-Pyramimonas_sp.AAC.1